MEILHFMKPCEFCNMDTLTNFEILRPLGILYFIVLPILMSGKT